MCATYNYLRASVSIQFKPDSAVGEMFESPYLFLGYDVFAVHAHEGHGVELPCELFQRQVERERLTVDEVQVS